MDTFACPKWWWNHFLLPFNIGLGIYRFQPFRPTRANLISITERWIGNLKQAGENLKKYRKRIQLSTQKHATRNYSQKPHYSWSLSFSENWSRSMRHPKKMRSTFLFCEYSWIFKMSFATWFVQGCRFIWTFTASVILWGVINILFPSPSYVTQKVSYRPNTTGDVPDTIHKITYPD